LRGLRVVVEVEEGGERRMGLADAVGGSDGFFDFKHGQRGVAPNAVV
jgi:hypothetical protein